MKANQNDSRCERYYNHNPNREVASCPSGYYGFHYNAELSSTLVARCKKSDSCPYASH